MAGTIANRKYKHNGGETKINVRKVYVEEKGSYDVSRRHLHMRFAIILESKT